jgi:hypothetical protein
MWIDLAIIDSYVQMGLTFLQEKATDLYNFSKRKAVEFANSPQAQSFAISAIWIYCSAETQVYFFLKGLYDDNRLIRGPVDLVYFIIGTGINKPRLNDENKSENWFEICKLVKEDEKFSLVSRCLDLNSNDSDIGKKINEIVCEFDTSSRLDTFFTLKQDDIYIIRTVENFTDINAKESDVKFISIEYTHSLQETPIDLKLSHKAYVIGNELFSPAFILNALENQSETYHFDMDYVVKLIDGQVKSTSITSKEYILIDTENTYEIKENK